MSTSTTLHDTHLYDAERHDNQIVAVFADRPMAEAARDALRGAGVDDGSIHLVDEPAGGGAARAPEATDVGNQVLGAFMSLFSAHDDHAGYNHAVSQGHVVLVVTPKPDADRHQIVDLISKASPIDFDAKLAEWRQAGFDQSADGGAPSEAQRRSVREQGMGNTQVRSYLVERN